MYIIYLLNDVGVKQRFPEAHQRPIEGLHSLLKGRLITCIALIGFGQINNKARLFYLILSC